MISNCFFKASSFKKWKTKSCRKPLSNLEHKHYISLKKTNKYWNPVSYVQSADETNNDLGLLEPVDKKNWYYDENLSF